jgi:cytoskeleton protein RodZ
VGEFGEKFRKERAKKNFSLDDVAGVTKIGTRMLQAIEEENFDRLPGGVFNKGFIRTYAKHLGMNDDKAVADYLARVRQTQVDTQEPWEPAPSAPNRASLPEKRTQSAAKKKPANQPASKTQTPTQIEELPDLQLPRAEHVRPPRMKYLNDRDSGVPWSLVALAALVVVLALFLWNRHSHNARAEASAVPTKAAASPQSSPAAPPSSVSYQTASARSTNAVVPRAPGTQPSSTAQSATAVRSSASKPVATGAENSGTAGVTPPANPASAPLTLIIRASENSWISVRADGQEVTAETLIAPAHTSVRAAREITVKTGNAAGINFLWNGKEVPAQGAEAEVRTVVFDAAGVRVSPAAQPPVQNQ